MRILLQRVKQASVTVDGQIVGEIGHGLLIFLGIRGTDTSKELDWMVNKCLGLRIFPDENGKMNRSVQDIDGEILVVSQFTLYGDAKKGFRPGFTEAAGPDFAIPMYEKFIQEIGKGARHVGTGIFGADMDVSLVNAGPTTIWLEKERVE